MKRTLIVGVSADHMDAAEAANLQKSLEAMLPGWKVVVIGGVTALALTEDYDRQ